MLYDGVSDIIVENLNRLSEDIISSAFCSGLEKDPVQRGQEEERLLKAVHKAWSDHTGGMERLRNVLSYMERVYVPSANLPGILDLGRDLFARHLMTHPAIKDPVISSVLSLVRVERDGYVIDRSVVRNCVNVLLQLSEHPDGMSMYARYLGPQILCESDMYYKAEAIRLRGTCDCLEYESRVDARLSDEEIRAHQYLSTQTLAPLQDIIQNAFRPSYPSFMELFASM